MSESFAEWARKCPDEDLDFLRELLSYDMLCPNSCKFIRIPPMDTLMFNYVPSPLHWSRQIEWPWILRNGDFRTYHDVLDIGGGWGVLKYPIAMRSHNLISLDHDEESLKKAQVSIDLLGPGNIEQVLGDARHLPFKDASFDRVVCCSVLEHIKDGRNAAIQEALRVLKPGGRALITMDIATESQGGGDFFLNKEGVPELLTILGISSSRNGEAIMTQVKEEGVQLVVLMICYVKERNQA